MNKYKRGQSEIITTVLIILLVLAAVIIVWQVVKSTVQSGSEQITSAAGCISINLDITGTNKTAAPIYVNSVKVKRGSDSIPTATSLTSPGLNAIKVIVEDATTGTQMCNKDVTYPSTLPVTLQELSLTTACATGGTPLVAGTTYNVKIAPKINGQQCDIAVTTSIIA